MQADYTILKHALPGFLLLLIVETVSLWRERKENKVSENILASLGLNIGALILNIFTNGIVLILLGLVYRYRLFSFQDNTWGLWIFCFFADDLSYYWFHRCSHQVRFLWASHMVHHSSEAYTLAGGLRLPWTSSLTGTFLFWAWMPLLGITPRMVILMKTTSVIYQFWLHTEAITRLPKWFESVFNTPSHHRVHHASDVEYLDKNHAGTLIIWDKLFLTYQEEKFKPTYGLTENINSFNPIVIAFHEWKKIFSDCQKSSRIKDRFNYFFNSPGWCNNGSSKTTKQLRAVHKIRQRLT